jgi:hypothetical protein
LPAPNRSHLPQNPTRLEDAMAGRGAQTLRGLKRTGEDENLAMVETAAAAEL